VDYHYEKGRRELEVLIQQDRVRCIYQAPCLNLSGPRSRKEERFTNSFAKYLLQHLVELGSIQPNKRCQSYSCPHHGQTSWPKDSRIFNEKRLVRAIFNQQRHSGNESISDPDNCIGELIDYEIPLKQQMSGDPAGDIDLLGVCREKKIINLIEVKILPKKSKRDTLLRAVMEIFTYYMLLDRNKFLDEYKDRLPRNLSSPSYQLVVCSQAGSLSAEQMKNFQTEQKDLLALIEALANQIQQSFLFCDFTIQGDETQPQLRLEEDRFFFAENRSMAVTKICEIRATR